MKPGSVPQGYQSVSEWNDAMVDRYDIDRYYQQSHALVRWIERRRIATLKRFAAARRGERILEVGCGAGHVLAEFQGFDRTGVDLSPKMLARARRRLGPEVRLLQASAEQLPLPEASYDVVLCTEVLEHTVAPEIVIGQLMRVARPGARVVVSIPNENTIDRAKRVLKRLPIARSLLATVADEGNEWHLHHLDRAALRRMISGTATIKRIRGVPSDLLAARYVALLGHDHD